jgi:hypothetical protein
MQKRKIAHKTLKAQECPDFDELSLKNLNFVPDDQKNFDQRKRIEQLQTSLTQIGADLVILRERLDFLQANLKKVVSAIICLGDNALENQDLREDLWESHAKDLEKLEDSSFRFF